MNPNRFADDRDYASDMGTVPGMSMNVFSRIFEIKRQLDQIQTSIEELKTFQEGYDKGDLADNEASAALAGVKRLMRALDTIEYALPELNQNGWFTGFQSDVHHAYWRVEEGRFDGVLEMEQGALDGFAGEVDGILENVSDSTNTNPLYQLQRFIDRYGDEFDPRDAPEEYYNEVFEARDLFCLGYYSTGLIVLGRAVERALLHLGHARKINSVDGFRGTTEWEECRFFERTEALYNIDMPDGSGKMISKRQYHLIQLLIDYRNKVAHKEYRTIPQSNAARMMGQSLTLLTELEDRRIELDEMDEELIREVDDVSIDL